MNMLEYAYACCCKPVTGLVSLLLLLIYDSQASIQAYLFNESTL